MKAKAIPIKEWLESLKQATQELMSTSLRFDRVATTATACRSR